MNKLQKALGINALFSGISGIMAIILHRSLANLFGLEQSDVFWMVGIALIFFASTILLEVKKQRRIAILWIITQDFIWVIASAVLLILQPFNISSAGNSIIAVVALIVLGMAINQSKALAQAKNE